jgi:hypothetical protein
MVIAAWLPRLPRKPTPYFRFFAAAFFGAAFFGAGFLGAGFFAGAGFFF